MFQPIHLALTHSLQINLMRYMFKLAFLSQKRTKNVCANYNFLSECEKNTFLGNVGWKHFLGGKPAHIPTHHTRPIPTHHHSFLLSRNDNCCRLGVFAIRKLVVVRISYSSSFFVNLVGLRDYWYFPPSLFPYRIE